MSVLHFAFPDGVLDYSCPDCTAICCRGQGFAAGVQREMPQLIRLYPALSSLAVQRAGDLITFAAPGDACTFLRSDNLCRIEVDHGRTLKPVVCRLFPFNVFSRLGPATVVSPHFMCPLRLRLPRGSAPVAGRHSLLDDEIRASGYLDDTRGHLVAVPLRRGSQPAAVLEEETRFRDLCTAGLGEARFDATLRAASPDAGELDRRVRQALRVLRLRPAPRKPADGLDDVLLALAPSLRLQMRHLSEPGMLVALSVGEQLLRRAVSLQDRPVTLSGAHHLWTSWGPGLRLLGRAADPFHPPATATARVPRFGDPGLVFAAFRMARLRGSGRATLDVLEEAIRRVPDPASRMAFVVQMGTHLDRREVRWRV